MRNASASFTAPPELPLHAPTCSKNLGRLVLLGEEHSGRDEMNLAGHPFALLQAAGTRTSKEPIFYDWPRTLPDGKKVTASWRVGTDSDLGMPGPNDELLYLVMLQLTREAATESGEWPQVVHFSRADLLNRLGWNHGARMFQELGDCFARLNAVNISAKWAFYDARTKAPAQQVNFHILSNVAITPEPSGRKRAGALPLSWFKWDDVLYSSFLAGNVRSLALDFTLSLQLPTARRLFRLLDMLRLAQKAPRREITIGAFKLRDRLGMTPYKHPSKVKEKVMAGARELQNTGYLSEVEWDKAKDGSPLAVFRFGKPTALQLPATPSKAPQTGAKREETPSSPESAGEDPLLFGRRMAQRYQQLPEEDRLRLLAEAKTRIGDAFWNRLENPESPASLALWQLVERETS